MMKLLWLIFLLELSFVVALHLKDDHNHTITVAMWLYYQRKYHLRFSIEMECQRVWMC